MDEYVRKADAVVETKRYLLSSGVTNQSTWNECVKTIAETLDELEPADVVPVVHAYWILQKENYEFKEVWMKCSACGYPVSRWTGNTNFCPNCGAKMDGEECGHVV